MNGEIEPTARGSVEPYKSGSSSSGNAVPVAYVPTQRCGRDDAPDDVVLPRPADTELQEWWSKCLTPFRAPALAFLWLTFAWWRFAIFIVFITTIILLFARSEERRVGEGGRSPWGRYD